MDKFGFYRGKKDYGDEWIFGQLITVENDPCHTIIATSFKREGLDDIVRDFLFCICFFIWTICFFHTRLPRFLLCMLYYIFL